MFTQIELCSDTFFPTLINVGTQLRRLFDLVDEYKYIEYFAFITLVNKKNLT